MKKDKRKVELFLSDQGLKANPFPKSEVGKTKTPDFQVRTCSSGELLFYCEVKSIMAESGGIGKDPIFNRLTNDIHDAAKQFDAINRDIAYPNVLALVNHDNNCGFLDLCGVITGNAITERKGAIPIYRLYSEGRIKDEKSRIHLFIWFDDFKPYRLLFNQTEENHHTLLCTCMNVNPSSIKMIDS